MKPERLAARIDRALADPALTENVRRATDTSSGHRREVVAERPDWEALRDRAAAIRDHVLTHLDEYLAAFAEEAEKRGAIVHVAYDRAGARRIILDLIRARDATRILKSKSMTTEEIGLNAALEAEGIHPLETDLGEYIVQLADEPPSHITAPALHRSAEQIRDLFAAERVLGAGKEPPADRRELATWLSLEAREHLRPRLLDADVGITGANFAVAETGSLVIVENEGNIRYTTTSPPLQIALVGIEKIVPHFADVATLLPLLTRSATGQRATSYVSFLSGGVEELHVVLLDAGRSGLLGTEADREILRCIRCGACLNVCPVYRSVGGHAYGSAYPGPIGALVTPLLRGDEEDSKLPFASTLCGACTEVCPVRIDLHGRLLDQRARTVEKGRGRSLERLALRLWRLGVGGPRRYRWALRLARLVQGPAVRLGLLGRWTRTRAAPRVAKRSFRDLWGER